MAAFIQILKVFWFFLPAAFANMMPLLLNRINFLDFPIDFGKKFKGKPIFGKNKTFRGFVVGVAFAILVLYLQVLLYPYMVENSFFDYSIVNVWLLGFLFGFGALFGDLIESFFKRQLNISPGGIWVFFDQVDWIFGGLIFVSFYIGLDFNIILGTILLYGILHLFSKYLAYLIGISKSKI